METAMSEEKTFILSVQNIFLMRFLFYCKTSLNLPSCVIFFEWIGINKDELMAKWPSKINFCPGDRCSICLLATQSIPVPAADGCVIHREFSR